MVHHRQSLALGLKPGDDTPGVHAELDHLEGHPTTNGLRLFGDIDHAATAFAEFLADLVMRDHIARLLRRRGGQHRSAVWARGRGGLKEFSGVIVRPEQELDALTQLSILARQAGRCSGGSARTASKMASSRRGPGGDDGAGF